MSTDLAPPPKQQQAAPIRINAGNRGCVLTTLDEMWKFSVNVGRSGLAPKGLDTAEKVFTALQMGLELGLSPMQAIQNVAVINGRPVIWGDAMLAICRASGVFDDSVFEETIEGTGDNMVATCIVGRIGGKPRVQRFSMADAKKAQLANKPGPWQQYPQRMLGLRARGFALRDTFPDFLKGIKCAEEEMDTPTVSNAAPRRICDLINESEQPVIEYQQPVQTETFTAVQSEPEPPQEPEQPANTVTLEATASPLGSAQKAAKKQTSLVPSEPTITEIKACKTIDELNLLGQEIDKLIGTERHSVLLEALTDRQDAIKAP